MCWWQRGYAAGAGPPRRRDTDVWVYSVVWCSVYVGSVHDPASQYSSPLHCLLSDQTARGGKPDMVILEEQLLIISFEASPLSFPN